MILQTLKATHDELKQKQNKTVNDYMNMFYIEQFTLDSVSVIESISRILTNRKHYVNIITDYNKMLNVYINSLKMEESVKDIKCSENMLSTAIITLYNKTKLSIQQELNSSDFQYVLNNIVLNIYKRLTVQGENQILDSSYNEIVSNSVNGTIKQEIPCLKQRGLICSTIVDFLDNYTSTVYYTLELKSSTGKIEDLNDLQSFISNMNLTKSYDQKLIDEQTRQMSGISANISNSRSLSLLVIRNILKDGDITKIYPLLYVMVLFNLYNNIEAILNINLSFPAQAVSTINSLESIENKNLEDKD